MFLDMIKAAALLLSLSLLQSLIARRWRANQTISQVLSGLMFGGICVVGMMAPIVVVPGVIFDPRTVILSMAGLFGGPLVATITAAIAGGYRAWLGGGGAIVGVAVVVSATLMGLTYRQLYLNGRVRVDLPSLLAFGLVVHLVEVLLFTQLPEAAVDQVMTNVALPLIVAFTPATALLGLLLKDIERRIQTEADLADSEARLSLHLQNTPLAAISWDRDFHCTQWNKAAANIFGYSAAEALGRRADELIVPPWISLDLEALFKSLLEQTGGTRSQNENITKEGRVIVCEWYNTPITNTMGETIGVVSLCEDVTAKRQAEQELIFKNTLLTTQQEASLDGILSVGPDGKVLSFNRRFVEIWGLRKEVIDTRDDGSLLAAVLENVMDPESFLAKVRYLYEHREETSTDELALRDGKVLERHSAPLLGSDGIYYGRLWMFRDISARKQSEKTIWRQANFDRLTGLANRQMLRERLDQEMKKAHRTRQRLALLYLDLDRFKDVNDSLGHDLGDKLLVEAAARLQTCVRETDMAARLGGGRIHRPLDGTGGNQRRHVDGTARARPARGAFPLGRG